MEHAEQLDAVFAAVVYVPAAQELHTPLAPVELALPATYAVLMYCPAGQEVTAVARPVFAVDVHTLVTY